MPLPVDPLLLLMLMTILVPSCGASRHAGSGRVLAGDRRRYVVERVLEVVVAIPASIIYQRLCIHQHKKSTDMAESGMHEGGCVGLARLGINIVFLASSSSMADAARGLARISAKGSVRVAPGLRVIPKVWDPSLRAMLAWLIMIW